MTLSIITINRNNNQGLQKTLQSVLMQSYDDYEYIVIDGNSTDGSEAFLRSTSNTNFSYSSEPDSGIYNAMNKGIMKAQGDYLLFLNSGDTLLHYQVLENVINQFDDEKSFIGCNLILDKSSGREEKTHPKKISFNYLLTKTIYHPSTFIKKEMFEKYGVYNEKNKIVSDWEFFFKTIALNGESFQSIPIALTLFDMDGISSNMQDNERIVRERKDVVDNYLGVIKNSKTDLYLFNQLQNPSHRIKLLMRIEDHKILKKIATVTLKFIAFFMGSKK